jgi:hypothetical protein
MLTIISLRPIPPPASQRLEERSSIGEPVPLRLDASDQRLLICLLSTEKREVIYSAKLLLLQRDIKRSPGSPFGGNCRFQAFRVELQGI